MSYKKKLIAIYMFVVLIPLFIFGASVASINTKVVSIAKNQFPSSYLMDNDLIHRYLRDYEITIGQYPDLADNNDYLDLLFNRYNDLMDIKIFLDDNLIYENNRTPKFENIPIEHSTIIETDNGTYALHLTYAKRVAPESMFRPVFLERALTSIVIYILLHFIFMYVLIKRALPDTQKLTDVANNISQGNYDFEVDVSRSDEIGEVYKAFDNMRESLQIYENNRKELITNISHDLKTPIATIKGYVTGIKDGLASSPEKQEKYLNIIYNNTLHLDNLINDLFLFSKLDVNQVEFNFKPLNLNKFVDYYVDELNLDLEEQGIQVHWLMPDIQKKINADGFRLRQVLENLVNNSVKHFDKAEKHLYFNLIETPDTLRLKISDNGKGIKEEHLDHIFNRFYRVDASRNTTSGSSGLGLAIVKQMIEKHNGFIEVESVYGQSTSITLVFPIEGEKHG